MATHFIEGQLRPSGEWGKHESFRDAVSRCHKTIKELPTVRPNNDNNTRRKGERIIDRPNGKRSRYPAALIFSIGPLNSTVLSRTTHPKVHHMSKHMTFSQEKDDRKQKSMM